MNGKDWNDLGGDLNRIIEDAVHMGDFGRLNENINRTIKKAFQGISGEEFRSGDGWDFDLSGKNVSRNNETADRTSQQAGPAGQKTDSRDRLKPMITEGPAVRQAPKRQGLRRAREIRDQLHRICTGSRPEDMHTGQTADLQPLQKTHRCSRAAANAAAERSRCWCQE